MKKEQPEIITLPLRTWLLKHWVDLMLQRMEAVMQSEDTIRQAKEMLILDESCNVPYLEWNPSERKLRIKKDRDPMTLSQVLELLKQMQILILQPLAVLRFHTTRELVQNMQSEVVPLMLQIGSRTAECHQLWNAFYRLSHSGACRVVATSPRSHGPLSAGIGNPAHDRGHVRTLRLLNTSNFCYSNAAALAFCWIHKTGLPGAVEPLKPAMMRVIRWLCSQTRPVNLWQHVAWRAVHSGWLHPTQQHDIAEYLTYLKPQLHDQIRYGSWEARQYHDGTPQHLDEGHTWPLYLPASLTEQASLHSEPITLQHLVDRWSLSQAGLHGLTSEPPVVLIQINRFHTTSTQCHKVPVRVFPDPYLVLPKFAQHLNHAHPLELQYVTYCRATSLLHEGPQPLSGHYRAVLHDATVGDLITDDSKPAARINMSTDPQHQANCYAFLYLRCPESCSNLEG